MIADIYGKIPPSWESCLMKLSEMVKIKRKEILVLASKYGAKNVRVFGSVARGEAGEQSDLDLLVNFEADRSLLDHVGFVQDLSELLNRKVDVVSERALHWYIRDRVLKEAVPL